MLMKRGGQLIYAGPLGHQSCKVIKYFQVIKRKHNLSVLMYILYYLLKNV
jgi:hypothetical protein